MPRASIFADFNEIAQIGKQFTNYTMIGQLRIDCSHGEEITFSNTSTDYPLQSGVTITDHIFSNPVKLRVAGSTSDTSSSIYSLTKTIANNLQGNILQNALDTFKGKGRNQIDAYEILKDLWKTKAVFAVVMLRDSFENVSVETVRIIDDEKTGKRLYFEAVLKQLDFAAVKTVNILANPQKTIDTISSTTRRGTIQTNPATTAQEQALLNAASKKESSHIRKKYDDFKEWFAKVRGLK